MIVLRSATLANLALAFRARPVGQGMFACEEDRKLLRLVLETLLERCVQRRDVKSERDVCSLFLKCSRHTILAGLPWSTSTPSPQSPCSGLPSQEEQKAFLADLGFQSWHHRRSHGWTTLMCAAIADNPGMVRAALAAGVAPEVKTKLGVPLLNVHAGNSALHFASLLAGEETVTALLEGRADPNQPGTKLALGPLALASEREESDHSSSGIGQTL